MAAARATGLRSRQHYTSAPTPTARRRCRSSEVRSLAVPSPFALKRVLADGAASAATTPTRLRPGSDATRRIGRLLEDQSEALDEELQDMSIASIEGLVEDVFRDRAMLLRLRLDDGLDELRCELGQVRTSLADEVAALRSDLEARVGGVATSVTDLEAGMKALGIEFSAHIANDQSPSSRDEVDPSRLCALETGLEEFRETVARTFDVHRREIDELRCLAKTVELQGNWADQLVQARAEIMSAQRVTEDLRNIVFQELQRASQANAAMHGALECHASECLGQLAALWVAIGQSACPAVGRPACAQAPSLQGLGTPCAFGADAVLASAAIASATGGGAIGSGFRGDPECTEKAAGAGRQASIAKTDTPTPSRASRLPPRPTDVNCPQPSAASNQNLHLRGRCSDFDACPL